MLPKVKMMQTENETCSLLTILGGRVLRIRSAFLPLLLYARQHALSQMGYELAHAKAN